MYFDKIKLVIILKRNLLFIVFRDIIMVVTYVLAMLLENASFERMLSMSILFAVFMIWIHIRELFFTRFERFFYLSFIPDILILMLLDNSSRFVVNYYFNVFYFFTLISAGLIPRQRQRLLMSLIIIAGAFYKYLRFFEAESIYKLPFVVSYIFFTLMVFVTIGAFLNYSRLLSDEKKELDRLNNELKDINRLMKEKNRIIKELTVFEERNRIAGEIHDSVGHSLTGLIMNLDYCKKIIGSDQEKISHKISKCSDIAKESLSNIRKSVKALKPKSIEQFPLIKSLEELVKSSKEKFNIDIFLEIKGEIKKVNPEQGAVIYRAIQEAITNSIKHGKSNMIEIFVSFSEDEISVIIRDNGCGCEKIVYGNGLEGMSDRVLMFGGVIKVEGKEGFKIKIKMPVLKDAECENGQNKSYDC